MGQHDLLNRFQLNTNHTYMVSWSLIRNWSQHYVASFVTWSYAVNTLFGI